MPLSSSSPSLTLLGPAFSRVFRCIWMLEELGVPYQHVSRTFPGSRRAKALHPLGKVPMLVENYQMEDQFVMTESANINQYLADKFGTVTPPPPTTSSSSLPSSMDGNNPIKHTSTGLFVPQVGTRLRARQDQLVFTIMTELDAQGVWVHRKHDSMGKTYGHIPQAVEQAKQHFDQVTQAICETTLYVHHREQKQLDETVPIYLLGPNLFSTADILFVHCLDWAKAIQWGRGNDNDLNDSTPENLDNNNWQHDAILAQYWEQCHQRPAYQRAATIRREENLLSSKAKESESSKPTTSIETEQQQAKL